MAATAKRKDIQVLGFKNITANDIWIYGSNGELVELPPEEIDNISSLPATKKGEYYIVEGGLKEEMEKAYIFNLASPQYVGIGREEKPIYHLSDIWSHDNLVMAL